MTSNKADKSLLGKIKNIFSPKEEEPKQNWNSKDWIEIKAPSGSALQTMRGVEKPIIPLAHKSSSSSTITSSHTPSRGAVIPQSAHHVRPATKDRIQQERTSFSGRDPAKPVERMSADEIKKKWPGAFDQRR